MKSGEMCSNKWLGFFQVTLLYILQNINAYLVIPNYNLIKQNLKVSDIYLGIMTGGYLFLNGLAALLWSYASDVRGFKRKILLASSYFSGGILTLLTSISPHPYLILLFWVLTGGFLGAIIPLGFSIISDLFEREKRTPIYMLWYTLGGVGLAIGYAIAIFLGVNYGWRRPLFIGAFTLIIIGVPLCFSLWEPPRGISEVENIKPYRYSYPYKFRPQDIGLILSNKSNIYVALQGFFGTIPNGVLFTWSLQFLIREVRVNEIGATIILGIASTGALGGLALSYVTDKLYKKEVIYRPLVAAICSFSEGILFAVFFSLPIKLNIYTDDVASALHKILEAMISNTLVLTAVLIFFIAMFFNSSVGPIRNSVLSDINLPEHRATVLSAIVIMELFSKAIGITIVGILSDVLNTLRYPMIAVMLIWVLSGIAWLKVANYYTMDAQKIRDIIMDRMKYLETNE